MASSSLSLALCLLWMVLLVACRTTVNQDAGFLEGLIRQSNSFGLDLHGRLTEQANGGNVIASPFSVSVVLAMMAYGARGSTAGELNRALFGRTYASSGEALDGYGDVYNAVLEGNSKIMTTANMMYPAVNFPLRDSYKESVEGQFGATLQSKDYINQTATEEINEDISRETNGRIPQLIEQTLGTDTRMVLVNTVFFKGGWKVPFPEGSTREADFYAEDGTTNGKVQLMSDYMRPTLCTYDPELRAKAIQLPYNDSTSSMLVILPDNRVSLSQVQSRLTPEKLQSLLDSMHKQKIALYLPKFKIESSHELIRSLQSMGIEELFDQRGIANLEGMTPESGLYVSEAIQRATIEVNEQGTEASAATYMRIIPYSAIRYEPFMFRADRPFMFAIMSEVQSSESNGRSKSYVPLFTGTFISPN